MLQWHDIHTIQIQGVFPVRVEQNLRRVNVTMVRAPSAPSPKGRYVAALLASQSAVFLVNPSRAEQRNYYALPQAGVWDESGTPLDHLKVLLDTELHLRHGNFTLPTSAEPIHTFKNPISPDRQVWKDGGTKVVDVFHVGIMSTSIGISRLHYSGFTCCRSWAELERSLAPLVDRRRTAKWSGIVQAVNTIAESGKLSWGIPEEALKRVKEWKIH